MSKVNNFRGLDCRADARSEWMAMLALREQEKQSERTYRIPKPRRMHNPILFRRVMCSFQIIGIGSNAKMRSMKEL